MAAPGADSTTPPPASPAALVRPPFRTCTTIAAVDGIEAVVFDMGGVVLGSPLEAIAAYERELGLAPNSINRVVVAAGEAGAWSRL